MKIERPKWMDDNLEELHAEWAKENLRLYNKYDDEEDRNCVPIEEFDEAEKRINSKFIAQ